MSSVVEKKGRSTNGGEDIMIFISAHIGNCYRFISDISV
jgi:hypothetical protein